jgi:UDP-2-acetamido-2,6-beta-L-arabino-hexul-4-ose reductase
VRVLITGARGFIGKNLAVRLNELGGNEVVEFTRVDSPSRLPELIERSDAVVHLAGENRPKSIEDFSAINTGLTRTLCDAILVVGRKIPLILASSTQAELDNPYGQSKHAAERLVESLASEAGNPTVIYRLPGVFGKWCKPNYNSVVATYCNNVANELPIQINDPTTKVSLVYIDDVVREIMHSLSLASNGLHWGRVTPEYSITLGDLAALIHAFRNSRISLITERDGTGLVRALYATYVSYLPPARFFYDLPKYGDERGVFVEMMKTPDTGQFSCFTALPGVTRGGHYHHSKTEKFLVVKGKARFGFRHLLTNDVHEIFTSGEQPRIVETVPGWTHDITNVGDEEMVVMLWANEIFDRDHPDTIACRV